MSSSKEYILGKSNRGPLLVKSKSGKQNNKHIPFNGMQAISKHTAGVMGINEEIMDILPNINIIKNILVSAIISPNNLTDSRLNYKINDMNKLPSKITLELLKVLQTNAKIYDIDSELQKIVEESLFINGAYTQIVIPSTVINKLINKNAVESMDMESFDSSLLLNDIKVSKDLNPIDINIDLESISVEGNKLSGTISTSDIDLEITDNLGLLKIDSIYNKIVDSYTRKALYDLESLNENNNDDNKLVYRIFNNNIKEPIVNLSLTDDDTTLSIPIRIDLSTSAVIPIFSNKPDDHLGYFILTDQNGKPISTSTVPTDSTLQSSLSKQTENVLTKKISNAFNNKQQKAPMLTNTLEVIDNLLTTMIEKSLNNNKYKTNNDIMVEKEISKIMLFRTLEAKKTKLLFIPKELMTYIAFEYRQNGTGKSQLEKISMLASIRAMLLFAKLNYAIENNIPTTNVTITLDPDKTDVETDIDEYINEYYKSKKSRWPLGSTNVGDISEWAQTSGIKFTIRQDNLPTDEVEVSRETGKNGTVEVDNDLIEQVEDYIYMTFGLTRQTVDNAREPDFASSSLFRNALTIKQIDSKQKVLNPQLSEHIRRIYRADGELQSSLSEIIVSNKANIIKHLNSEFLNKDTEIKDLDDEAINFMVNHTIDSFYVELPKLDIKKSDSLAEKFSTHVDNLETMLDAVLDDRGIRDTLDKAELDIDQVKSMLKSNELVTWSLENGYLESVLKPLISTDKSERKDKIDSMFDIKDFILDLVKHKMKVNAKDMSALDKLEERINSGEVEETTEPEETPVESGEEEEIEESPVEGEEEIVE